jgi:hypothetical protein
MLGPTLTKINQVRMAVILILFTVENCMLVWDVVSSTSHNISHSMYD